MPSDPDTSAKLAIFEAAQRLFAKEGFEKVSMRALTQEAGVNLAGVNYHFGSKQGLIDAVTTGFVNPVNEARLALLDKAEAGADGALPLETILDCFMRPVLEAVGKSDMAEQLFFQLMGRCMNERSMRALPTHAVSRFPQAIGRALPSLSEKEIIWRLHFTVGVLIHVLIHTEGLLQFAGDRVGRPSLENILTMVITYCRAGLEAPQTELPTDSN
ncbi:MAG: TetR/AcrR family transcriptional regulator [Verrucomicrobiales bacterium]